MHLEKSLTHECCIYRPLDVARLLLRLLPRLQVVSQFHPPSPFLHAVDSALRDLYSDIPDNITAALEVMTHISRIMRKTPNDVVLVVLCSLSDGLSVWIGDEDCFLLEQEHNETVS